MTTTQDRTITIGEYVFDEKAHLHTLEGKPLTGVTTVLGVIAKPALIQWAANTAIEYVKANLEALRLGDNNVLIEAKTAHNKKKEAAGEWGTTFHSKAEAYINLCIEKGSVLPYEDEDIKKFVVWSIENNVKFLSSEKHLYSREWWVGGIADIICEIDGKRYIGDIKTSSGIYPEAIVQTCAYAKMAQEMGEKDFDGVIIINCDKRGGFKTQSFHDIPQGIKVFESALNIYRFKETQK